MTDTKYSDEDEAIDALATKVNNILLSDKIQFHYLVVALIRLLANTLAGAELSKDARLLMLENAIGDLRGYFSAYMDQHDTTVN